MRLPTIMGVDPALGGGNSLTVCALETSKLWVLDARVDYGLSKTEEIFERIKNFAVTYRPHTVIVEYDAQQKGIGNDDRLAAMGTLLGFEVKPHVSQYNKKLDPVFNVAAMNQSFVKREISIPWGDDDTRRRMEPLVSQLKKWRPDVPTKQLRQDAVMSLWFCWRYWMQIRKAHEPQIQTQQRPSWITDSPSSWMRRVAS